MPTPPPQRSALTPLREAAWSAWYGLVSRLDRNGELTFLNYGCQDDTALRLRPDEERDRYAIQLYRRVAAAIPGDPATMSLLEIGCGRGGGLVHLASWLAPKRLVGVDICRPAVAFCRTRHADKGITFLHGSASALPADNGTFDAVINVESSHRYPDMTAFLRETRRVLQRPGYLSLADFRPRNALGQLRETLAASGFDTLFEHDITPQVLRALDLDDERKRELIDRLVPRPLRKAAREFACVVGSASYRSLADGRRVYLHLLLSPAGSASARTPAGLPRR